MCGGGLECGPDGLCACNAGSLHGNVLGLEVVLADGTILDALNTMRKDNTGYDLKQLFVGAEGTLGIITTAALHVARRPLAENVAFVGCASFDDVRETAIRAKRELAEVCADL